MFVSYQCEKLNSPMVQRQFNVAQWQAKSLHGQIEHMHESLLCFTLNKLDYHLLHLLFNSIYDLFMYQWQCRSQNDLQVQLPAAIFPIFISYFLLTKSSLFNTKIQNIPVLTSLFHFNNLQYPFFHRKNVQNILCIHVCVCVCGGKFYYPKSFR